MPAPIRITPHALRDAAVGADSWRGLCRALGYASISGSTRRRVERLAVAYGVDLSHFSENPGPRVRWTDSELREAIKDGQSWRDVAQRLNTNYRTAQTRSGALGLDVSHLSAANHYTPSAIAPLVAQADTKRFHVAAEHIAAAWYSMHGFEVYVPAQRGSVVDLIATNSSVVRRVQVKSSRKRAGTGWMVSTFRTPTRTQVSPSHYSAADIDEFFIVTEDGQMYRLPFDVVGEMLRPTVGVKYEAYRVHLFQSLSASGAEPSVGLTSVT